MQTYAMPLCLKGALHNVFNESGRRGSNSRPLAWKANALSTELLPHYAKNSLFRLFGGKRWIRTTEGKNQQIYSLPHLATLVSSLWLVCVLEPMEGFEPPTS